MIKIMSDTTMLKISQKDSVNYGDKVFKSMHELSTHITLFSLCQIILNNFEEYYI